VTTSDRVSASEEDTGPSTFAFRPHVLLSRAVASGGGGWGRGAGGAGEAGGCAALCAGELGSWGAGELGSWLAALAERGSCKLAGSWRRGGHGSKEHNNLLNKGGCSTTSYQPAASCQ
jgi:hypothetical protein